MTDIPPTSTRRTTSMSRWAPRARGRVLWALASALLVVSAAVTAAVLIRQDVAITPAAQATDVRFVDGGGGAVGFATVSIGSSGASASLSLTGIAGAAMQVSDLLRIQNTDETQAYAVTLSRSAAPHASITGLTFTVLSGATTVVAYNAATAASSTAFTLPAGTIYDIRIEVVLADGTAIGSLSAMALHFSIVPA